MRQGVGDVPSARKRREQLERSGRRRSWQFGLLAGAILLIALFLVFRSVQPPAGSAGPGVEVRANMGGFSPRELRAEAGQPLTIILINEDNPFHSDGGGKHNFIIEALGVQQVVDPEKTLTFTFTTDKPGEYDFYCDICCGGKENPNMHGRLVVT